MFDGKKTLSGAALVAIAAVLGYLGVLTPEVMALLEGLGVAIIGVGLRLKK